jgi:hypothetical protein
MESREDRIRLTPSGRLLSNEVFERFILADKVTVSTAREFCSQPNHPVGRETASYERNPQYAGAGFRSTRSNLSEVTFPRPAAMF